MEMKYYYRNGRRVGTSEKHHALVVKMAESGATLNEIGRKIGTTGIRVHDYLKRIGKDRLFPKAFAGSRNPNWRGGKPEIENGYVKIYAPDHPHAHAGRVFEHRLVMEKSLGRYLLPNEVVHHKNKNKSDNRLKNLELFETNAKHLAVELNGKCPKWTKDGLKRMMAGVRRSAARKRGRSRVQLTNGDWTYQ